jgi:hypothetical protein
VTEDYYNWTFEEYTRKEIGDLDLALKYLANASEILRRIGDEMHGGHFVPHTLMQSIQHNQAAFPLTNAEMSVLDAVEAIKGSRARFARLLPHDGGITSPGTRPQGTTNG